MKKVLYLSNIEVPYRVKFFNQFAKDCDLTVVYEKETARIRNDSWSKSEKRSFKTEYIKGIGINKEFSFSFKILKYLFKKYDSIIVGCYNSPSQILAVFAMRMFKIPYIVNLDGEIFLEENGIKNRLKRYIIKGADCCLTAGERVAESLKETFGNIKVFPYYFSSFTKAELAKNAADLSEKEDFVLVVGQYLDVKGMDVALEAAKMDSKINYKFVGMGTRTEEFEKKYSAHKVSNVEIIPFLQREDLEKEYKKCKAFVLPSRKECWGLVINEAASFGVPIVSTLGSGAAVEFLRGEYPQYLAKPSDYNDLYNKISSLLKDENTEQYKKFLIKKSQNYSIEKQVEVHKKVCNI